MSPGPIDAVLFDFSRTLFCVEEPHRWVTQAGRSIGLDLAAVTSDLADQLMAAGRPGGSEPTTVPEYLREVSDRRDLSTEDHRAAYVGLMSTVELPDPRLADALYDRLYIPDGWVPYADAVDTVRALRDRGIAAAVVSNIAWDLRPLFAAYHLDMFDQYVFSHEVGVQKPDHDK